MEEDKIQERRLASICRRMGKLWTEDSIAIVNEEIPETKQKECNLTLLGKLHFKPNVNFQAFYSTMMRAWKIEDVVGDQIQQGLFTFTFQTEAEKERVLADSPWSFAGNLLVLQQLKLNVPIHCHDFKHCAFWVQVHGLPLGRITTNVVKEVASKIGMVQEVKLTAKDGSLCKVGRARVFLDLALPLKSGIVVNFGINKVWVDFRYERLPSFCYSCGKIGHYTTNCDEVPYKKFESKKIKEGNFGYWLKAEARETSPFWKLFYGEEVVESDEEEVIPDTPNQADEMEEEQTERIETRVDSHPREGRTEQRWRKRGKGLAEESNREAGNAHTRTQLMILDTPWKEASTVFSAEGENDGRKDRVAKKAKTQLKPTTQVSDCTELDDSQLHDTPIMVEEGSRGWALVASPNKPPGDK